MGNVYLIVGHSSREMLEDIFRHVWSPANHYILHVDRKGPLAARRFAQSVARAFPNVVALPSRLCSWGGWTVTSVILDAMHYALSQWQGWDHFIALTESHLPLRNAEECARYLDPGVTYCEGTRVVDMFPAGREDALHRLEWVWPELPGVGHFLVAPRVLPYEFMIHLHHGSPNFVLAHDACARVVEILSHPQIRDIFSTSPIADETAIQTALFGFKHPVSLPLSNKSPTFIGLPHLSGTADLTFSEANFFDAASQGFCFIRKRPAVLPASIQAALESSAAFDRPELLRRIEQVELELEEDPSLDPDKHAADIMAALAEAGPDASVRRLDPTAMQNVPALDLVVSSNRLPNDLAVYLISGDLVGYKLLLLSWTPWNGVFEPRLLDGQLCHPIRVRVYDLFCNYEIPCAADTVHGFGRLAAGPQAIAQHISMYLDHAIRIVERRSLRSPAESPPSKE